MGITPFRYYKFIILQNAFVFNIFFRKVLLTHTFQRVILTVTRILRYIKKGDAIMKKRILIIIFLLFLTLFVSCKQAEKPLHGWNVSKQSEREFSDFVEMQLIEIDLDSNTISYKMYNVSELTCTYGHERDFQLEVLRRGKWYEMYFTPTWDVPAVEYVLNPGQSKEYTSPLCGELSPGTYRFIKKINLYHYICCEFVIK